MEFREVDRCYTGLKQHYDVGTIGSEEFDAQLEQMRVRDAEGRWWARARESGQWVYHDGATWIAGTPPGYDGIAPGHEQGAPSYRENTPGFHEVDTGTQGDDGPGPTVQPSGVSAGMSGNTSGMGSAAVVPREISEGWNWGAFLLGWIWALGHRAWDIAVLSLVISFSGLIIPFVGPLIMAIVLGVKGNEWAWRSKHWDSVEHFRSTQRKWTWAGVIVLVGPFVLLFLVGIIGVP